MDRLNKVHRASRVQLPQSIVNFDSPDQLSGRPTRLFPRYIGIIGFLTCGAVVIAAASLLALSI